MTDKKSVLTLGTDNCMVQMINCKNNTTGWQVPHKKLDNRH